MKIVFDVFVKIVQSYENTKSDKSELAEVAKKINIPNNEFVT